MSLREAAALTGLPRRYLRERIEAGSLAVHLQSSSGSVKWRLSRGSLVQAGLLTEEPANLAPLFAILREQGERLASLEEQRFQLAAQVGMAVERSRSLEERLSLVEPPPATPASLPTNGAALTGGVRARVATGVTRLAQHAPRGRLAFVRGRGPSGAETDPLKETP